MKTLLKELKNRASDYNTQFSEATTENDKNYWLGALDLINNIIESIEMGHYNAE